MAVTLPNEVLQDQIAISVFTELREAARAMAVANKHAHELGVDVSQSLINITQRSPNGELVWLINYGPKDYIGRRGGDLLVEVGTNDSSIKRVLWGQ